MRFQSVRSVKCLLRDFEISRKRPDDFFGKSFLVMQYVRNISLAYPEHADEIFSFHVVVFHETLQKLNGVRLQEGAMFIVPLLNEKGDQINFIAH